MSCVYSLCTQLNCVILRSIMANPATVQVKRNGGRADRAVVGRALGQLWGRVEAVEGARSSFTLSPAVDGKLLGRRSVRLTGFFGLFFRALARSKRRIMVLLFFLFIVQNHSFTVDAHSPASLGNQAGDLLVLFLQGTVVLLLKSDLHPFSRLYSTNPKQ